MRTRRYKIDKNTTLKIVIGLDASGAFVGLDNQRNAAIATCYDRGKLHLIEDAIHRALDEAAKAKR